MEYITVDQLKAALPRLILLMLLSGFIGAALWHGFIACMSFVIRHCSDYIDRGSRIRIARFRANARNKLSNG